VVIRHPTAGGKGWEERRVDLAAVLKSGDCTGDVWLEGGDVVEIPEADHAISAPWPGLSGEESATLKKCLTRHVEITVKGQTTKLGLSLDATTGGGPPFTVARKAQFTLMPVLYDSKLLLTSSDLSHLKVTRRDPASGQQRQWVFDCSDRQTPPDFWLRDGDVIDVPEK
jgi:hypothetical protein